MRTTRIILAIPLLLIALAVSSQASMLSLYSGGTFGTGAAAGSSNYNVIQNSNSDPIYSTSYISIYDQAAAGFGAAGFGILGGEDFPVVVASSVLPSSGTYTYAMASWGGGGKNLFGEGSAYSNQFFQVVGTSQDSGNIGSIGLSWFGYGAAFGPGGLGSYGTSPLIVSVNGFTVVTIPGFSNIFGSSSYEQFGGNIEINVAIGDIIGITWGDSTEAIGDRFNASSGLQVSLTAEDFINSQVPLPSTLFLLGSGLLGLVGWRRFRKG